MSHDDLGAIFFLTFTFLCFYTAMEMFPYLDEQGEEDAG